MIVVCPTCSSAYELPAERAAAGARVRCGACREAWYAPPADATPQLDGVCIDAEATSARAAPNPFLEDDDRRRPVRPVAAPRAERRWGQAAGIAALLIAPSLAIGARDSVVARAPAAARLYAAIGLPVNLAGLELRNIKSQLGEESGQRVLAVSGELTNVSRASVAPPRLEVSLRGEDGRAIYVWTADAPKAKLAPGETASFRTRLATPPERAHDVRVSLADVKREERTRK